MRNITRADIQKFGKMFVVISITAFMAAGCSSRSTGNTSMVNPAGEKISEETCLDPATGLMWQTATSHTMKSIEDARLYADNLSAGGYDDWRLPTVEELYNLYMTFDLHQNGKCEMNVEGVYWSGEEDLQGRVGTWELDDNCDPEREYIPKKKGVVRAVRL